ncbi:MAG: sulfite exporter TauE/SafE family protein [Candidatus Hermodarchaeota archaeon]
MPCEDKSLFFFYSFGITKDTKNSLLILILYGLGLMTANMTIAVITVLISLVPLIIFPAAVSDPYAINFFGSFSSTFVAIFLLFFMTRRDYSPHSKHKQEIINLDWDKRRTPYLLGVLSGFPPCIFELFIYSQCLIFSLSYGFVEALLTVFYFSIGTFIGLFPLALAKSGFEQKGKKEPKIKQNRIYIIMFLIIIVVNTSIMILSFLHVHIFPVQNL